jgi:nitroreductase
MNARDRTSDPWSIRIEDFPRSRGAAERLRFLLRYAILAPSTRNTQPWIFRIRGDTIEIRIDLARAQPIADADRREMFISAGCALENLQIAARQFGYNTQTAVVPDTGDALLAARLTLTPDGRKTTIAEDAMFDAITARNTNHGVYDGRAVTQVELEALALAAVDAGMSLDWIYDGERHARIEQLVMRADALLLSRSDYRHELGERIGTGAFGTPWLLATLGRFAVSYLQPVKSFAQADQKAIVSSFAIGVISGTENTRAEQVRTGQALERVYLKATELGLAMQPVSQLMQLAEMRDAVAALLPQGRVPLQPLRLGHAKSDDKHTPRRPLEDVLAD